MLSVIGYITLLVILIAVGVDIQMRKIQIRKLKRELEQLKNKKGNSDESRQEYTNI